MLRGWPDGIKIVQKLCTPHNTNAFAMKFAEAILTTPGMIDDLVAKFKGGRSYLIEMLDMYEYEHKGEAGNFLFIKPKKKTAEYIVGQMKMKYKILIKSYPNVGKFGDCLRVSIGEKKYMEKFISALNEIERK